MKCPNCRKGRVFTTKHILPLNTCLQMHERCTECHVKFIKEQNPGYGINYVLTVMMLFLNLVWYYPIFGIRYDDNSLYYFLTVSVIITLLLQPWFMRLSRILFLYFTIYYHSYRK
ncbi:hypothetical protein CAP35_09040 [Chitinophagaceae bacterium IBVUCB1]|nr:hypothetical protein CAP35_09040 [Chitinophagaceae bacterium IBVUCB1]